MSSGKLLDISYEKLIEIAEALNENSIKNKSKSKEYKIPTDKFLRQKFNIDRKNFSFTIKQSDIKYNPSTFLYDIPKKSNEDNIKTSNVYESNSFQEAIDFKEEVNQSNTKVYLEKKEVNPKNTFSVPEEFKDLLALSKDLKDMLNWWKNQTNPNIIDVHIPKIDLHNPKLKGKVVTKSYKIYEEVANEFANFAAEKKVSSKETIKDLVSLSLIEFMDKYK